MSLAAASTSAAERGVEIARAIPAVPGIACPGKADPAARGILVSLDSWSTDPARRMSAVHRVDGERNVVSS